MVNKKVIITPVTPITKIQEYLKGGCDVEFSEGIYKITKTLFIYSNTNIIINKGAVLVRKNPSHIFRGYINPKISYNYNAVQNITITGEGKLKNGVNKIGSMIGFMHGCNITIEDIYIVGTYKSHSIDIPACKNVTIKNVKFSDRVIDSSKAYKEEIQIDYAMSKGYPYWNSNSACYNDNHCENILIELCNFSDANYCIGTHTETNSDKKHINIQIINCTANGTLVDSEGTFVKIINTDGVIINGNKIKGFNRAIEIITCGQFYNSHGIKYITKPSNKTGCKNVNIEENIMSNACGNAKASGIFISSKFEDLLHSDIIIKKNKFRLNNMSSKYDIYSEFAKSVTVEDNDVQLDVKIK